MTDTQADIASNSTIDADASLAIMKADMQAALQQKQHDDRQVNSANSSEPTEDADYAIDAEGNVVLDEVQTSRVIEMAWEDRTPFGAIEHSYGLDESAVIELMRKTLKPSSFRLWRERVTGRNTKHEAKRDFEVGRAYCKTQYKQR